ncbi:leucine-rich repeat-containing protein 70 [Halyomorpha halys]|uniref:leucine-rich repeat-containing protein 70 n=1 Tax=Halyomorpha halys TaxID=286706 RepID=UPI000D0C9369|nr:leucine-rich repeat-containing protein 15-like [Halyomorpha halys]
MTYKRRVHYQIILISIFTGLLWCAEIEKGCKRSVALNTNALLQIECTHLPKMNLPPDVRSLIVQGNLGEINKGVLKTSFMVHKLNVSNCNISSILDRAFCEMNQLRTLILTNNHIEYIEEETFSNLKLLTELHIDGNNLKVIIPRSFKDTAYLKNLNLENNQLLEIPAELPKTLVILNAANNDIEYIDMESLKNLELLETLNLGNNSIKKWPKVNLSFPSLQYLSLGSSITSAQITGFSYPKLKYLHLSAKLIYNANFQGITITEVDSLEELDLENYIIYDLQFLNHLKNLKILHFTRITYYGKDVTSMSSDLIKLNLDTSPEIANLLLNSKKLFHQLSILSLRNSNITTLDNNQADRLMKTISTLDISQNPIRCSISEWSWIFNRVQIQPSFLIDKNNVVCNTPSELKGKSLLTMLYEFYHSEEQKKITFMSIMEEYVATYGKENKNIPEDTDKINDPQHESKSNIVYGILIALTLMGTLFLFIHLFLKKPICTPRGGDITVEYSRSNERVNLRKTNASES